MQITGEVYKTIVKIVDERMKGIRVTREDFNDLKAIVKDLAKAQEKAEERLARLEDAVAELAEAQRRTEEKVEELAEAQKRTEEKVEELAEAQRRTEQELMSLTKTVKNLQKEVGGISHTIGYTLENAAYKALPHLLKEEYNIELERKPVRQYLTNALGREEEVNIYGLARKGKEKVVVIGESKSHLSRRHVDAFLKKVKRLDPMFSKGKKFLLMITHQSKPKVLNYAKEKGIRVYFSYDFD